MIGKNVLAMLGVWGPPQPDRLLCLRCHDGVRPDVRVAIPIAVKTAAKMHGIADRRTSVREPSSGVVLLSMLSGDS